MTEKGRPPKDTIDYFPHMTRHGKTIAILESRYGNDGYAVWFKTLEILGDRSGHFLDTEMPDEWEFMLSRFRVSEETALGIFDLLARVGAIDGELWTLRRVIFSENFCRNLTPLYSRRTSCIPERPSHLISVCNKSDEIDLPDTSNDKVKYSKVEKKKTSAISSPDGFDIFWKAYPRKVEKADALKWWERYKPGPELLETMLAAIDAQTREKAARLAARMHVPDWPHGSTWLNKKRWEDVVDLVPNSSGERKRFNYATGEME